MKTREKLQKAYNKQLKIFEDARNKKILNIKKQLEDVKRKKDLLNHIEENLTEQLLKESQKSFNSFDDFFQLAQKRSLESK